jgi:hypothetical protein
MHHVVLLGNRVTNPWIQAFDKQLGLRWRYDRALGIYYPQDTWAPADAADQYHTDPNGGPERVGYAGVSFLPNPKGSGNVAIFSATGGASYAAVSNFLTLERNMEELHSRLPNSQGSGFPYFEALFRIVRRPWAAPEVTIVLCRLPRLEGGHR